MEWSSSYIKRAEREYKTSRFLTASSGYVYRQLKKLSYSVFPICVHKHICTLLSKIIFKQGIKIKYQMEIKTYINLLGFETLLFRSNINYLILNAPDVSKKVLI